MNASLGDGVALECGHTHFIFRWLNLVHTHVDGPPDVAASVSGEAALATLSHEREADLARLVDAARAGTSTLLIGEAGSGKDTLARAIHNAAGQRADFVAVRCRLLGREADARPGSVAAKLMRDFERAAGGTLFLDEIEELTPVAQLALLPLLQSARRASLASIVSSVRSNEPKPAVPSMPADLLADLAGFALRVAPLRERREDLGTLVAQILASATDSASSMVLEPRMGQSMLFHDWPYNLSELDRCVRGAVSTATSSTLRWSPATLFSVRSPASSGRTETVAPARAVPQDEIGSEPDPEFVANVRRALKCNLSPSGLRNNGLVGSYMVLEATGESSAPTLTVPALRNIVLSAIESLRQSSPRGERQSRVLDLTFIRPAPTQQEAADQLAMAFGTYRRYVTSALAELTSILWFNELGARMRRESDQATSGGGGDKLGSA